MTRREFGILFCALPMIGFAQDKPAQAPPIVQKYFQSLGHQRFIGTRLSESRVDGRWIRNTETITVNGQNIRIDFSAESHNANETIIEAKSKRTHYFFNRKEAEVSNIRRDESSGRLRRSLQHGTQGLVVQAGGSIAGRATDLVVLNSPESRPLLRMWIDSSTGVLLKREAYDRKGERISSMEYSKINYFPRLTGKEFSIDNKQITIFTQTDKLARICESEGIPLFVLKAQGFELEGTRAMKVAGQPAVMQLYVNGDARLSLFVVKGSVPPSTRASSRANLHHYFWKVGDTSLGMISELTENQLRELSSHVSGR